jgi:hypothetical protein
MTEVMGPSVWPGRRLFFLINSPAGGGVADQLWGRVGSSGLATARIGLWRRARSAS